jgi:hypothetical protein
MKYLKHINELYKRTYLDAADALRKKHPSRAEELEKWGEEKGISKLMKKVNGKYVEVDRDFAHPFNFKSNSGLSDCLEYFKGNFYITGSEQVNGGLMSGYERIWIFLYSDYHEEISLMWTYSIKEDKYHSLKIKFGKELKFERDFLFDNRKDAMAFKRYLIEDVAEDLGKEEYLKNENIPINSIYSTK